MPRKTCRPKVGCWSLGNAYGAHATVPGLEDRRDTSFPYLKSMESAVTSAVVPGNNRKTPGQ